jgi:predicted DCC family thiol-disulfide oxidoreductase YuxK
MTREADTTPPIEVWYDGQCSLCRRSRRWCLARDAASRLRFRDFRTTPDGELPVDRHLAEQSLWVRRRDGELSSGFEGWRWILRELPGWRPLAAITGLPGIRHLGSRMYRLVARFRRVASG